jgi:hypothetical protein
VTTAVQVSANTGRHGRRLENVSGLLVTVAFGLAFR